MMFERPFPHENAPRFESLLNFTASSEGFRPELIEKDYFCSLILAHLHAASNNLVFKGGTCLGKVHLNFFRLSEDLDFCVLSPNLRKRAVRQDCISPLKVAVESLPAGIPGLAVLDPLIGRNKSTQYIAVVSYTSLFRKKQGTLKIEIALREGLLRDPVHGSARTLLRDAFTGESALPPFLVQSIEFLEALAEKTRAALTRLPPAIRDFFDLDYANQNLRLDFEDDTFLELVRRKLAVPGTGPVDLSHGRRVQLEKQVEGQLRPVLRSCDYLRFDLQRIWAMLTTLAEQL
ncbi:MAG: nucleotidyl transferase AbiEii/AbiGii toxin family protein [Deltaproteobacteria bacterium]